MTLIADRRLYLTADKSRVVEAGDREAHFLLASPGHHIVAGVASRLGLVVRDGRVVQAGVEEPAATPDVAESQEATSPVGAEEEAPIVSFGAGRKRGRPRKNAGA